MADAIWVCFSAGGAAAAEVAALPVVVWEVVPLVWALVPVLLSGLMVPVLLSGLMVPLLVSAFMLPVLLSRPSAFVSLLLPLALSFISELVLFDFSPLTLSWADFSDFSPLTLSCADFSAFEPAFMSSWARVFLAPGDCIFSSDWVVLAAGLLLSSLRFIEDPPRSDDGELCWTVEPADGLFSVPCALAKPVPAI